jgi:tellurite resistance protein TehA-like permease
VPTLWIVLGPLGQSITAASLLGTAARLALPFPYGAAFQAFGVLYGVPVWGFAVLWAALATAITVRAARAHLPFTLTWWSFTFPLGTLVTGTTGLALHTGSVVFHWAAAGLYLVLVAAWIVVSVRTAAGTWRGTLLRAAPGGVARGRAVLPADEPVFPADEPVFPADEVAGLTPTGEGITGRPA